MTEVGIRALKQNASEVVAHAAAGETIVITDRGRAVAQLSAIPATPLDRLRAAGRVRPPRRPFAELSRPAEGEALSPALLESRESERY